MNPANGKGASLLLLNSESEWRKIKCLLPVHCSSFSHVHYMTQYSGMFLRNKITVMHSCSFDNAVREAFRLFPNVPEIKEKQKKCLKMFLDCVQLGWEKA